MDLKHFSFGFIAGVGILTVSSLLFLRVRAKSAAKRALESVPIAAAYLLRGRLYLNSAAEKITGYSTDELQQDPQAFSRLFGMKMEDARLWGTVADGRGIAVTVSRKDGESHAMELIPCHQPQLKIWLLFDVTNRIRAEERFRVLFENSQDGYLLFDNDVLIDCNPAAVSLMGLASKEEMLTYDFNLLSPDVQPDGELSTLKSERMTNEALAKGHHRFEWIHKKKDGTEFPVEVTLISVQIASRPALIAIWHDQTEQKRTQSQMLHTSNLAALGEMASGLAHEINNPLSIIQTRAEALEMLLESRSPTQAELLKFTQGIVSTVDRIAKIIKGMRNAARDSSREPCVSTELKRLFEETLAFCELRYKSHGVQLDHVLHDPELKFDCHPVQISQVLLNLLNNAFDAVHTLPEKWVRIEARSRESHLEIVVTDSGGGIPPEIRQKLMQPFFSTKGIGKGTGLGLSISRSIIAAHRGSLELDENCPNTRFVIRLPLQQADIADQAA